MAIAQPIIMPKFGQTVEEAKLVVWHKKEGDTIARGEVIFEIETDKATLEVESFQEGTLLKILVKAGQTVPVQVPVAFVGSEGDEIPAVEPPARSQKSEAKGQKKPAQKKKSAAMAQQAPSLPEAQNLTPETRGPAPVTPRAKKLARESVIKTDSIAGSGPNGRVVEKDVAAYLEMQGYASIRISPAAKTLAANEDLDVIEIATRTAGEKISVADVKRAVAEKPKELSKMRQVIAQRLQQSFMTIPHFYVTVAVDMTDLIEFRTGLKEQGLTYTVTDFIGRAVVEALTEFPAVNSTTDGVSVRWNSQVNLGIAVSLESGLVVPAVKNADELSLSALHDRSRGLVTKAREGKLTPDEMSGSTFTISNMGMMDVENFAAIINPGESAILAIASTVKKAVVVDDEIIVRSIMKMTLSGDHRIVDGALGLNFVNAIKTKLEDVEKWNSMTLS